MISSDDSSEFDKGQLAPDRTVAQFLDDATRERWSMSPDMQARYEQFQANALGVTQRAIAMRQAALESRLDLWRLRLEHLSAATRPDAALELGLDGALSMNSADFATIQLYDPMQRGLILRAQRGLGQPFVDFFAVARSDPTAWGRASRERRSVVVQDVVYDPIFIGSDALAILLEAEIRGVICTPLVGNEGSSIGVLSVYYRRPHTCTDSDLVRFEALASAVVHVIEEQKRVPPGAKS